MEEADCVFFGVEFSLQYMLYYNEKDFFIISKNL